MTKGTIKVVLALKKEDSVVSKKRGWLDDLNQEICM
jgi:hypothetical protein